MHFNDTCLMNVENSISFFSSSSFFFERTIRSDLQSCGLPVEKLDICDIIPEEFLFGAIRLVESRLTNPVVIFILEI